MAISALTGIPLYQPRPANDLNSLIQGLQAGQAIQQAPQQFQNNQINQMLQQALLREKLMGLQELALDRQDPNRAVARQAQQLLTIQSLNPNVSGVVRDPEASRAASILGGPIARPGTVNVDEATGKITQVTSPQEALQGISINGIPTDFIRDLSLPRAAKAQADINEVFQEGAKAKARNAQKVFEPTIFTNGKGDSRWIQPGEDIPEGFYQPQYPPNKVSAANTLKGYDTVTGLYGVFQADEMGMFPDGVVPASQAPKAEKLKTISNPQVDQLTAFDVLSKQVDLIKKTPKDVRKSNVGWIDSGLGAIQSLTGLGTEKALAQNEGFRNAVQALISEYSFGRGGKSLTINEKEILGRYLPALTNSNAAFEARLDSFGNLVKEMKASRLQTLEDSGYDVSRFNRAPSEGVTPTAPSQGDTAPAAAPSDDPAGIR